MLLSPLRQEDLGRPLPDPTANNRNIQMYRDAIRKIAEKRGHSFIDLFDILGDTSKTPLTDNGIHPTGYGYWRTAAAAGTGPRSEAPPRWKVEFDAETGKAVGEGVKVTRLAAFEGTDPLLPAPLPPKEAPKGAALPGVERGARRDGPGRRQVHAAR